MDAEDGRAFGNVRQQRNSLEPRSKRPGQGRLEDEDIPKSDWGRTLDTTVSIPEGAEERADQHEANASREHALEHGGIFGDSDSEDAPMGMGEGNGGVGMTALGTSVESREGGRG